ncbi:MAG: dihydropyrimidinase [Oscillospiraceae bacterium]
MKKLIIGGLVVSATKMRRADILIDGEQITAVGTKLSAEDAEVIDANGRIIFPGFIDAHTHFDLGVCDTTTADDFLSGSRAALRGGTTTVIDFACPNKGESLRRGLELWHEKAYGRAMCDYGFHMTIDDWNAEISEELSGMENEGITSFKMYMTYPAMMLGDGDMLRALMRVREMGGIVGVHCENSGMIDALTEKIKSSGLSGAACHPISRPDLAEAEAINRLSYLAQCADVPVVIVHLSSALGFEEARRARERGAKIYIETCPQYLFLDDSVYAQRGIDGAKFVCSPPIRKKADCDVLWNALVSGGIDTISTDHCSFTLRQKSVGLSDFTKIPGGLPGVETRVVLMFGKGVANNRLTAERMCALLAENPARLYGLYPQKGTVMPGSDADLVIIDPHGETRISAEDSAGNADYTPYEGMRLPGRIVRVMLRGKTAVLDGRVCMAPGEGKFLRRGRNTLLY